MKSRSVSVTRETKETQISLTLDLSAREPIEVHLGVPFFEHLLHALSFHGGFALTIRGTGDLTVDPHHLVEDTGIVLGEALAKVISEHGNVVRFGHAVIPMDDALSEVTIDACGRPYFHYRADYPQSRSGDFDMSLLREFFSGLASAARMNLHADCRYGLNSHHMAEALFKAAGKAIAQAFAPTDGSEPLSTKGRIG